MNLPAEAFALPEESWGFPHQPFWIAIAISLAVIIAAAVIEVARHPSRRPSFLTGTMSVLCLVAIGITLIITWGPSKAPLEEEWKADLQSWASTTYGEDLSDTVADRMLRGRASGWSPSACESGIHCHYVDRLVGGEIQRLQLIVLNGEPALFVGTQELDRR